MVRIARWTTHHRRLRAAAAGTRRHCACRSQRASTPAVATVCSIGWSAAPAGGSHHHGRTQSPFTRRSPRQSCRSLHQRRCRWTCHRQWLPWHPLRRPAASARRSRLLRLPWRTPPWSRRSGRSVVRQLSRCRPRLARRRLTITGTARARGPRRRPRPARPSSAATARRGCARSDGPSRRRARTTASRTRARGGSKRPGRSRAAASNHPRGVRRRGPPRQELRGSIPTARRGCAEGTTPIEVAPVVF